MIILCLLCFVFAGLFIMEENKVLSCMETSGAETLSPGTTEKPG